MKIVFSFVVLMLLSVGLKAQSWVKTDPDMTLIDCSDLYSWSNLDVGMYDQAWSRVATEFHTERRDVLFVGGSNPMVKYIDVRPLKSSQAKLTGIGLVLARTFADVATIVAGETGGRFIAKATVLYYPLGNSDATVSASSYCDVKNTFVTNYGGLKCYKAEITPKFPVQMIQLSAANTSYHENSELSNLLNTPVDGVIVTSVLLEYYSDYYKNEAVASDFVKEYRAGQQSLQYGAADVNRDEAINSADVVAVYNAIINGEKK